MKNKYEDILEHIGIESRSPDEEIERLPLTEEQLAAYEVGLGYSLPSDYREFVRDYGGISVSPCVYPLKDSRGGIGSVWIFFDFQDISDRQATSVDDFYSVADVPTIRTVLNIGEEVVTIPNTPHELIPIATDGSGQIYLALAGRQPGAVFLWMNWADIYLIADSFDDFMRSLYRDE